MPYLCIVITPGKINSLAVEQVLNGTVLFEHGITLPENNLPRKPRLGDTVELFVYPDINRNWKGSVIRPKGMVGDLVTLKVVEITPSGAKLNWGLDEHLFMPRGFHEDDLEEGDFCLVKIFYDEVSGKVLAKEKLEDELSNEILTVKEKEVVEMVVYKDTPLGYQVIVNGKHLGLLHYNEVFKDLFVGDTFSGFVKKIKEDNKLDVMIGKPGHTRVEDEGSKILRMLEERGGALPYGDKSAADEIYKVFGMSKKTFKMTIGNLYKSRKISIQPEEIKLVPKAPIKIRR